jgi:hypothetical protein
MTMREFMGRSNAALEKYHEIHERAHLEHSTWTSRKIDRLGYNREKGIQEKARFREGGDWFDMATKAELKELLEGVVPRLVKEAVAEAVPNVKVPVKVTGGETEEWPLGKLLRHLEESQDKTNRILQDIKAAQSSTPTE